MNFPKKVISDWVKKIWLDFKEREHIYFKFTFKFPDLHIPHTTNLMGGVQFTTGKSRLGINPADLNYPDTAKELFECLDY